MTKLEQNKPEQTKQEETKLEQTKLEQKRNVSAEIREAIEMAYNNE